uniref:Retrotransposon gag domain-containing protein n=1 Tax=Ananas comosus var. bracteatus TaxID=296719 RepID=A0A6V7NT74_ANACO|nr:unnamed protein product [Ananas comosus var. bracteatus]
MKHKSRGGPPSNSSSKEASSKQEGSCFELASFEDELLVTMPITRSQSAGAMMRHTPRRLRPPLLPDLVRRQLRGRPRVPHRQHLWWTSHRGRSPPRQFFTCGTGDRTSGGGSCGPTSSETGCDCGIPRDGRGSERDRLMDRLSEFRRCSPRTFDGENVDHWIVEKWLMHMEKLFRDTFVEERDRVWLATHFLDSEAYRWWLDIQDNPTPTWQRLLGRGSRSFFWRTTSLPASRGRWSRICAACAGRADGGRVREEFSRILHCVPFVVRDDEDKARIFERGLRPSIFRLVQSSNLQTYREVVDRAFIVEAGAADLQETRGPR